MPDLYNYAEGDEVTITWRAQRNEEWVARGRVERRDDRYIRLRERNLGLILIPYDTIIALENHGPCPWGPPYTGGRVTWYTREPS